jgi:threonine aldolase
VQTNIVYFELEGMDAQDFLARCREQEVLGAAGADGRIRFVTHLGVDAGDVQRALEVCSQALESAWADSRA